MSKATAYANAHKDDEEEKKVVGQQQKTQSQSSQPTGTTSIPKDNSRTQQSAASSLRTENNVTTAKQPQRETSKTTIYRQSDVPKQETKQTTMQSIKDYAKENYKLTPRQVSAKSNRIPDASVLPTASEVMGSGFKQSNNLNQYITSGQKFTPQTDSRQRAEQELENRLHNRDQLRNAGNTNTFKSLLSGAGAGALGTIGDLAGLAEKMSQNKSTEGMTPDEIYNRAMNTGRSWDNVYGNNIGSDYKAYKEYVLKQMESGAVTQEELRKMQDLEDKYSKNPAHYLSELGKDARAMNEGYSEGHKISNVAGQMIPMLLGNFAVGAVTAPEIAAAEAINNPAVRFAAQQGINLLPDVATDTIPEVLRNINEGKSADEVAKDAAKNLALNEAANLGFEYLPKGIKALADQANASNMAKRAVNAVPDVVEPIVKRTPVEEAAEQIVKAAEAPKNVDNAVKAATETPLNRIRGNLPIYNLADRELSRIAKSGGASDTLEGAYDKLAQALDTNNADEAARAIAEYAEAAKASGIDVDKSLSRLAQYTSGNYGIDVDKAENGLYVVSKLNDELGTISRLDLTPTARKHLDTAYNQLDEYEDALVKGENTLEISEKLEKTLESLHRNAKKAEGYNGDLGRYSEGTNRGLLRYNDNYLDQPSQFTKEEQDSVLDLLGVKDSSIADANSLPNANAEIPTLEAPNRKVSQTYTNTGKRGGGWNDAEYTKYTDPKDYVYETKSEADSVARAEAMRADEGREAFKERVFKEERISSEELDGLMMEWRELTEEARQIEANGGDASKLWDESNRVFRKIREQSTNNAQALQALAKWSRNTPEGMLAEAENIVNGKVKTEKGELQKQLEKFTKQNKEQVEFDSEFQKEFLNYATMLKGIDPNSRQAKDIMGQMGRLVDSRVPKKLSQKVQTWLMDSMLGNFRTLISRNAGGNVGLAATEQVATRPLAAGIDRLVAKKTGIRTQAGFSKEAIGEYLSGMKKGLADEFHDMKTGLHTARTGENTLENAIQSNSHVFKSKILDKFDSLVKNGLSMGDRPFYEATYAQTLGDYYRLRPEMGPDIAKLTDEQFKEYAETAANLNALAAVYQNDSKLAKGMLDLKNAIGRISEGTVGVDILSQFSMPFVKTPANVIDRAVDYSPVGLLRNAIRTTKEGGIGGANFNQNRFVNETARNIIGSGITLGGAGLAYAGGMSGAYSSDKDEKKAQQDAGMQEYALNVPGGIPVLGDKQVDIGWMPIVGSNLVAGAAGYNAFKNGEGSVLDNLYAGTAAGGNELFGQAAMQGAQRLFGGSNTYNMNEGIMENAKNVVAGGFGQAVPSIARQAAQVADPYKRDIANSNEGNYELNQVLNSLPYFRQNNLVPKVDSSGNPVLESQGRGIGSKILEDMILPGKVTDVQYNKLDEEAMKLSEETGNKFSYMPKATRKNVEEESRKLTNDEWYDYQVKYGQSMTEAGEAMLNNKYYPEMSPGEKEEALQDIYTAVKSAVNSEYKEKNLTGAAKAYAEEGLDAAIDYVVYSNALKNNGITNNEKNRALLQENGMSYIEEIKADMKEKDDINATDPNGKSNITQQEVIDYLNKNNMSEEKAKSIWDKYKGNSPKELQKNSNGEWELNAPKKESKKSSSKDTDLKLTGNNTLDARIKAKANWKNNAASTGSSKAKETTSTSKNEIPVAGVKASDSSWSVKVGDRTYDLHDSKGYKKAQSLGVSDNDWLNMYKAADANKNGKNTKDEVNAYIKALGDLTNSQKADYFDMLIGTKAKNPYR
jgi:hypothetical protein